MMFWAKIDQSAVSKNPQLPKYVFSSGGADKRSRGFALFHENGMFVLRVVAAQKKWRLTIENGKIPFNSWFSFSFTWKEGRCFFLTGGRFVYLFVFFVFRLITLVGRVQKGGRDDGNWENTMERRLETLEKY